MWQIDSSKITNYNPSKGELQALIIFWVLAAGKTAKSAERILSELIPSKQFPFEQLKKYSEKKLAQKLQSLGCGCFNNKAKTIYQLVNSNLNLSNCTVEDLEFIYGIGRKTSRGFILHTRKNAQCAVLDTHILKFLKEQNVPDVPKSTPSSKFHYERLEKCFLSICRKNGKTPAKLDLEVWNSYKKQ
jgi:thermostable 8-oxoguanine DNA glycosylase